MPTYPEERHRDMLLRRNEGRDHLGLCIYHSRVITATHTIGYEKKNGERGFFKVNSHGRIAWTWTGFRFVPHNVCASTEARRDKRRAQRPGWSVNPKTGEWKSK